VGSEPSIHNSSDPQSFLEHSIVQNAIMKMEMGQRMDASPASQQFATPWLIRQFALILFAT